jgi:hypothetical protein
MGAVNLNAQLADVLALAIIREELQPSIIDVDPFGLIHFRA